MLNEQAQLGSSDRDVRVEAVRRLLDLASAGDEQAREALREVVRAYRGFDTEVYSRALNYVSVFGNGDLARPLLAALADDGYGCQAWAAEACAELGVVDAEPLLIDLLEHHDGLVRKSACRALGRIRSTTGVRSLARRLEDESEFVQSAASSALADVGADEALEHLWSAFQPPAHRRAGHLAAALARFGPKVFDRLAQASGHPDPEVRYWTARALGSTGDERVRPILSRLMNDHATTPTGAHVSTAARKALRTLDRLRTSAW